MFTSLLLAYLVGSFPTGYLLGKLKGIDVRTVGSGNVGATNVSRALGKKLGILVLVIDILKGILAVLLIGDLLRPATGPVHPTLLGLAAFIGHCFPVWLRFRGGKGVATGAGIFMISSPGAFLFAVIAFFASFYKTKIVSLSSLLGTLTFVVAIWIMQNADIVSLSALTIMGAIVFYKHKDNIKRLLAREEMPLR